MTSVPEMHKATAPKSVRICVITCSTSKFQESRKGGKTDDLSGDLIEQIVKQAGHKVTGRSLIPDSKAQISRAVRRALTSKYTDVVLVTGGTGLSPRDITIETVKPMLHKEIVGFGELFRKISYDEIGPPAMLSRALGGVSKGKAIFCLPGSPNAVRLGLEKLILPELGHVLRVGREH